MPLRPPARCSPFSAAVLTWIALGTAIVVPPSAAGASAAGPNAPATPPPASWMIQHLAPQAVRAWRPLPLSVTVPGDRPLLRAEVYYRLRGVTEYTVLSMRENAGTWDAVIPAGAVEPPGLEYYLRVQARDGSVATRPFADAARAPIGVVVQAETDSTITPLSPAPGGETDIATPQIAAFFDPPLPPRSVCTVWLDGNPVRAETDSTRDYVSFVPTSPLAPGEHVARVEITGERVPRAEAWTFRVPGSAEDAAAAAGGFASSGRLSLGTESADGSAYTGTVFASLPQPAGTFVHATGDLSATLGAETISGWFSSTPSTRPRTQGAVLVTGAGHEVEAGTLLPWESELALAGPQASGGRTTVRGARGEWRAFGLHIGADEVGGRAIDGGATTVLGHAARGIDLAACASYGRESLTDAVDFASGGARSGWTFAPRVTADRGGWQTLAEWSLASWRTRDGGLTDSSATGHALVLSAIRGAGPVRASLRFTDAADGYHAMLAPFAQEGRRELAGSATWTRGGWFATGGYFVSRFTGLAGDSVRAWSHRTDASVSRLDARGQGVTLSCGTQDRSWFVAASGAVAGRGLRASLTVTRSHVADVTSWSGAAAVHAAPLPRLSLDATGSAALTQQTTPGQPAETLSRSLLPRLQANYRLDARNALEGALSVSSYGISLYPADLGGVRVLRTYHQTVGRLSYVRTW